MTVEIGGASGDVSANPTSLTFTPDNWDTEQTVTVNAAEDDDAAADAAVTLTHTVSGGDYSSVRADDVTVTVTENDTAGVTVSFEKKDHPTREGAAGASVGLILSAAPPSDVVIPITVSPQSTAGAGDYSGVPEQVTFAQGEDFTYFTVEANADAEDEDHEKVVLGFGPLPEGVSTGEITQATVTIKAPVRVSFEASSYTATEGGASAEVTVQLSEPAPYQNVIPLTAEGGNGADSGDWSGVPQDLTFDYGDISRTFTVHAVDDTVEDDGEMVKLGFGTLPVGFMVVSPATATVTIMNDDGGQDPATPGTCEDDGALIWSATAKLTPSEPASNEVSRVIGWAVAPDQVSFPGASLSDHVFMYNCAEYSIESIVVITDAVHNEESRFVFGISNLYGPADAFSDLTLHVGDIIGLPFASPRHQVEGKLFSWRDEVFSTFGATGDGSETLDLRIEVSGSGGTLSSEATATPLSPPDQPKGVSVTGRGDGNLTVGWTTPSDDDGSPITGYVVQWSSDGRNFADDPLPEYTVAATETSYTITGLVNGAPYAIRVVAENANGLRSTPSNVALGIPEGAPSAPNVQVLPGNAELTVTWDEPDNGGNPIVYYTVRWKGPGEDYNSSREYTVGAATRSYVIAGLTNGAAYVVRVTASNLQGTGPPSAESAGTPQAPVEVPPDAPGAPTGTLQYGEATLDWNDVPTATSYQLSLSLNNEWIVLPDADSPDIAVELNGSGAVVSGLPTQWDGYWFRVRSVNSAGHSDWSDSSRVEVATSEDRDTEPESQESEESEGQQPSEPSEPEGQQDSQTESQPPPKPQNLTANAGNGSITLTWDAPDDDSVTGYRILRRRSTMDEDTLLVYVGDTGSTRTTFTDTDVTAGVRHMYRVKAINDAGLSEWSNFARAVPSEPKEEVTDDTTARLTLFFGGGQRGDTDAGLVGNGGGHGELHLTVTPMT